MTILMYVKPPTTILGSGNNTLNDYAEVTGTTSNQIIVDSASAFANDDEVMIIQMQGSDGVAGIWETKTVSDVNGNTITFTENLDNTYSTAGNDKVQAVRVPSYYSLSVPSDANVICPAWNGSTGGIIFFRASADIIIDGSVTAYNTGFRSGAGRGYQTIRRGWCGETTRANSYQTRSNAYGLVGGGGAGWTGQANENTPTGGGGGGYGTVGQDGKKAQVPQYPGTNGQGGSTYGTADLSKIFLGSAGGTSFSNNYANGGGIIIISASTLTVNGTGSVYAGGKGGSGVHWWTGGGAGGSIQLSADELNINTNLVTAPGGSASTRAGYGGKGRIRLDYNTLTGSTNNPSPGYEGGY